MLFLGKNKDHTSHSFVWVVKKNVLAQSPLKQSSSISVEEAYAFPSHPLMTSSKAMSCYSSHKQV